MFEIEAAGEGVIVVKGRLDAAQSEKAESFLDGFDGELSIDLSGLEYVSSAGLGVFLKTHKRLMSSGHALRLTNVSNHINDIFKYSGFDKLFTIETG